MSEGELILYTTEDGWTQIQLHAVEGTVWLTQREIGELFDKDVRTINEHIQNIYAEGECDAGATIRKFRIVQTEGSFSVVGAERIAERAKPPARKKVGKGGGDA